MIDATPLLVRSAGVKNYLYHWILHLRRQAGPAAIATFPRMDSVRPLTHEASVAGPVRTIAGLGALALSNHLRLPVLQWMNRSSVLQFAANSNRLVPPSMLIFRRTSIGAE